ncbi:peptide transporter [Candidatus Acidianus copahuensis]|uniref:Peptide transporter n=1 Tax=Candidatus Acidianus copahuensis TaxID=1160895 RepID=A0A031LPZ0_9CREN|nr:ABC transporter permease [Candidatus Acidianus copahuensis]EZQ04883.1 peptide transporter [Candidatus Acidianus copahuensis]
MRFSVPWRYLVKRIIERIILLIVIINFLFLIIYIIPIYVAHLNPAEFYVPLSYKGLSRSTEVEAIDREFGLNQPIFVQYIDYVKNMLTFHFGYSLIYDEPVSKIILQALPVDLIILVPSLILSTVFAIGLGLFSAVRFGRLSDSINTFFAILTYFIPGFWVLIIFLQIFGFQLGLFPTNIAQALISPSGAPLHGWAYIAGLIKFSIAPIIILALLAYGVRMALTRSYGVESMGSSYVTYLRAKGIPERSVVYKHVMRNAIIPAITRTGIDFAFVIAGSVFVEDIFGFYGMGELLYRSALTFNVQILGDAFYILSLYVIVVLLVLDFIYPLIDPRVKYE